MKGLTSIPILAALSVGTLAAQGLSYTFDFAQDSPVKVMFPADFSRSRVTPAGGLYKIDVHASLSMVNTSQRRIRGITISVSSPEVSGKRETLRSSLDVNPSQTFSVPIDALLTPPLGGGSRPNIVVKLEGVLFDDLGFYGTDLRTRQVLTRLELEARRDRKYFKQLSREALAHEAQVSIAAQNERRSSNPGVQIVQGRATNLDLDHDVQVALVSIPDSPVEVTAGKVNLQGSEARAPRVTLRNTERRPVRHLDIGWIMKDQLGHEFYAASMPVDIALGADQSAEVSEDNALRFGRGIGIKSVTAYVAGVEFADGGQWIPPHEAFSSGTLRHVPASPEEQRLLEIYNLHGLDALIEELKKF